MKVSLSLVLVFPEENTDISDGSEMHHIVRSCRRCNCLRTSGMSSETS